MASAIRPWRLEIPQSDLDDLALRLARTRLPETETVEGWEQGVPRDRLADLLAYWRDGYDWRRCEARLNDLGQFRTEIDGLDIHFLHVRSRHENALPIVLTHGWPGSVVEFLKVIGPLTDPESHGGEARDAFHVVVPSLPGFGFSQRPCAAGWGVERIAAAWGELMRRLGYARYVAQGGDWGSSVTIQMGVQAPEGLAGIHLNMVAARPATLDEPLAEDEVEALRLLKLYAEVESAYARQQSTRPQTLGYALADSPAGQAAWIYEKFQRWSDCGGDPETILTRDELLDDIMLYWLPNCAASSARLYYESMKAFRPFRVDLPVGVSNFPKEIIPIPRKWADQVFPRIMHWGTPPRGGHFAAFEQPELFVGELRTCFAALR
ncbi:MULTISPECIES: epoxide hydrolase family protein [unclassified Novosphingobium]|uniref:epoxide hydrolase family protein n=1 Tax=unclassified Novosphingobium TaxID=2644732 RepID=UPI00135B76D6|nr:MULTISPECIES: epoxide hydrolase family protein [unclassified Novosphingobium]